MTERRERLRAVAPVRGEALPHIIVERVTPELDGGRFPVKRVIGDVLAVGADIFKDGHDQLRARVRYRGPSGDPWRTAPLTYDFAVDRWTGEIPLDALGTWAFTVEAWTDAFGTWRAGLQKKMAAGQDVHVELLEGAQMADQAARRTRFGEPRRQLQQAAQRLADADTAQADRGRLALDPAFRDLMDQYLAPADLTAYARVLEVTVERQIAAFASWYEFFPRSASPEPGRHGTFRDAEAMLDRVAALGFDVVYLPPIHPIGVQFRKGKNNALRAEPDDVGSPWAIGGAEGGHTAIHPELGTLEDFDRFAARARALGLELALDYALQCSPDHPWVTEHPDWFTIRPDGSIQYAENPPKKYQDIYPLNFWCDDREGLWHACRDVLLFWAARGVRTFRVDNPHTKPFAFWEWAIREVRREYPDAVFLAEAFTRPKKLLYLAKLGFSQSYTYFTWKNEAWELRQWLEEFDPAVVGDFYRGNLFANTPDILVDYLVEGGPAAFRVRLLLAATMSPIYGIYSGFELSENAQRPGSEEYLDNEKYELKSRDFAAPGNLDAAMRLLNAARRAEPALQRGDNLRVVTTESEAVFAFLKLAPAGSGGADLLVVANLDPFRAHDTMVRVPLVELGIGPDESYVAHDMLTGARYHWRGSRNYVRLDPSREPGHLFRIER